MKTVETAISGDINHYKELYLTYAELCLFISIFEDDAYFISFLNTRIQLIDTAKKVHLDKDKKFYVCYPTKDLLFQTALCELNPAFI
jgi:hypothetical protein